MKKIKVLTLVMVMALMIMGVGYAYWTDVLTVDATVNSGKFDVQFVPDVVPTDNNKVVFDGSNNFAVGRDVAYVEGGDSAGVVVSDVAVGQEKDKITLTLQNVYPGCKGDLYFAMANFGTVPAEFETCAVTITPDAGGKPDFSDHFYMGFEYTTAPPGVYTQLTGLVPVDTLQATINLDANLPLVQLDAGSYDVNAMSQGDMLYIKMPFEFKDVDIDDGNPVGAEEFEVGSIKVTLDTTWRQWNVPIP